MVEENRIAMNHLGVLRYASTACDTINRAFFNINWRSALS